VSPRLEVIALEGMPEIAKGDPLGPMLLAAADGDLRAGDVLVVSHKAVSKAEGRMRSLKAIKPGERALALGSELGKDPRLVQLILDESTEVIRAAGGVLIVETREGWICANAGIDSSNVEGEDTVLLLPESADASARRLRSELRLPGGSAPAVIVADTFGRAWRVGQADVALGCAGLRPLDDWRGRADAQGRRLTATMVAIADEVAAAADLVRPKDAGSPAAVVRGLERLVTPEDGPGAAALRRDRSQDLFR